MSSKSKIVGIDLGTTNSVVAVLEGASPFVIPNAEGFRTTPSIVAYTSSGEIIVGEIAKRQTVMNSENTFSSVKRFIGSKYQEIAEETKLVSYNVISDPNGNVRIRCPALKKDLTPEEISSSVLKKLAKDAGKYLNQTITQAVITVPAYFNDSQRFATKDAGIIAGLEVLRILPEPTAAALAYGLNKKQTEVVLIFDLGGGTFDVSILEVGQEVFEVLATSGDSHLGGNDFDQIIVNTIIQDFKAKHNIDLYQDKQALQRIIEASEKAKIELSLVQTTRINLPFIHINGQTPLNIDMEYDRIKFENQSKDLLDKCRQPVLKALNDAKLSKTDIDKIILVGGSTRIPAVRSLLIDFLGKPLNESVNPDEVVALGAAVQAGIVAGEITDLILLDVTPLSLGVETLGGVMTPVIRRNSSVPIKQSEVFSTGSDNQKEVEVHVLQGERPFAKDNKSLGIFKLGNIPPAPRGVPKINVTFKLDIDGLLSVSAKEETSGEEQSITVEGASVLDREKVSSLIEDAQQNSENDKILKNYFNISYEFDILCSEVEEILEIYSTNPIPSSIYLESIFLELKYYYVNDQLEKFQNELKVFNEAYSLLLNDYLYILFYEEK